MRTAIHPGSSPRACFAQKRYGKSAAAPNAGHMRHDHRAAWPVFLNIGRVADPHGVRTRIIARVYTIRLTLGAGVNANSPRRPGARTRGEVIGRQRLCDLHPLRRRLRVSTPRKQGDRAREEPQHRPCPDTHRHAHPIIDALYGHRLQRARQHASRNDVGESRDLCVRKFSAEAGSQCVRKVL
jgi:hypothetical protein